jgi:deoxyhypusine synthase
MIKTIGSTLQMVKCAFELVAMVACCKGGIEEDLIKCMGKTYVGAFNLSGKELRMKGQNRIGNMLVPNNNYVAFEEFMMPVLNEMLEEQSSQGMSWTPSKMIKRLGERIDNEDSVYYWCDCSCMQMKSRTFWVIVLACGDQELAAPVYCELRTVQHGLAARTVCDGFTSCRCAKHGIPVYCPALTDGSIGDMMFFHSFHHPGLKCDIVEDIRSMNNEALKCKTRTGVILLGGGVPKHHILNANLMRNGCDYCVMLNTAQEYDGSDSGARPDEAVSWGKIRIDGKAVKVCVDATIGFPLLVSQTFAKNWQPRQEVTAECVLNR